MYGCQQYNGSPHHARNIAGQLVSLKYISLNDKPFISANLDPPASIPHHVWMALNRRTVIGALMV